MGIFFVTYCLIKPIDTREKELIETIGTYDCVKLADCSYFVDSVNSVREIFANLRPHVSGEDFLIVSPLSVTSPTFIWNNDAARDWLREHGSSAY